MFLIHFPIRHVLAVSLLLTAGCATPRPTPAQQSPVLPAASLASPLPATDSLARLSVATDTSGRMRKLPSPRQHWWTRLPKPRQAAPLVRKCRGCTIVIGTGNEVTTATLGKVRAATAIGAASSSAESHGAGTVTTLRGHGNTAAVTAAPAPPSLGSRVAQLLLGPVGQVAGIVALGGGAWLLLLVWRRRRKE